MSGKNDSFTWKNSISLQSHLRNEIHAVKDIIAANDLRYSQRFDASQTALNAALEGQKLSVVAALAAADRAVAKAEVASEKRFDSVNEFRNTLADQQRTLMPRAEVEIVIKSLEDKITGLNSRLDKYEGQKTGTKEGWGWAVSAISLIVSGLIALTRFIH